VKPDFHPLNLCVLEGTMMIDPSFFLSPRNLTGQELSDGRRSSERIKPFKKGYQARAYAQIVDYGKHLSATIAAKDGTWQHAMIPETEMKSVPSATETLNHSPASSSSTNTRTPPASQSGRRGRYVSKCRQCEDDTYVRSKGLCPKCYTNSRRSRTR
jgi:hypothetical protein